MTTAEAAASPARSVKLPELLSPAGNPEKLYAAIHYGADSVYLAGKDFGMRSAADNFTLPELRDAVAFAHENGARAYITVNTMPRWDEIDKLEEYLSALADFKAKPDALIISDIGVAMLAREIIPDVPLHVSTQAGVQSHIDCIAWRKLGATRIVLARELSLNDIIEIRARIPADLELETFIHGSMCVSFSGRCLLSNHFTGRDANRGQCTQPCRWNYRLFELEEEKRPGESLPVVENDLGTFIMSSRDMCMIKHIPELAGAGIASLKIEGRMKSAYYAAVTANAYRMALDAYRDGKPYDEAWMRELESVSHREYCEGYFFEKPSDDALVCGKDGVKQGYIREKSYIAVVRSFDRLTMTATCVQRNKLCRGDAAELITPGMTGRPFIADELFDGEGMPIDSAPHPSMLFMIKMPFEAKEGDIIRM